MAKSTVTVHNLGINVKFESLQKHYIALELTIRFCEFKRDMSILNNNAGSTKYM